jgi:protease-4
MIESSSPEMNPASPPVSGLPAGLSPESPKPETPSGFRKALKNPLWLVLGLSVAFFGLFMISSSLIYFGNSEGSRTKPSGMTGKLFGKGKVGVIELNGAIMDSKKTISRLERFEEDAQVKAIVIRLNSPGGAVGPSQEIYEAVRRSKKPIVASMGSVAASGAFYVAMGAKKIFANPGTLTGSIGVIMQLVNLSKLYDWAKVQRYAIKTGKFKDMGADYREMDDETRALLQGLVDDTLDQFKKAIAAGRSLPLDKVSPVADGRIFSGQQALALGMVDRLGGLQDAIEEAGKLGKIEGKPKVVYPERPRRNQLLEALLEESKDEDSEAGAASSVLVRFGRFLGLVGSASVEAEEETGSGRRGLSRFLPPEPGIYLLWPGAN